MRHLWVFVLILALGLLPAPAAAKPVCVEADGESAVIRGDLPSAKLEARNRAQWAAVEQVAGVELKSRTIVADAALLEDVISTQARGIVSSVQLLSEQQQGDSYRVRIRACVEPARAQDAVSPLALNSTVSVFVTAGRLNAAGADDANIFSEAMNNALIQRGFTVRDLAEERAQLKTADLERALAGSSFLALRSLVYRYKSNTILIGRIQSTLSTAKGEDAGYGISMPFNRVTVRLTYRLLTRDGRGALTMLAAGTQDANGLAPHPEEARAAALRNLSEQAVPVIMEAVNRRMADLAHKVTVTVEGIGTLEQTAAVRDQLQQITWVGAITEEGIGRFRVTFPENPLYLANGLTQKGYRIISYSPDTIRVRPR